MLPIWLFPYHIKYFHAQAFLKQKLFLHNKCTKQSFFLNHDTVSKSYSKPFALAREYKGLKWVDILIASILRKAGAFRATQLSCSLLFRLLSPFLSSLGGRIEPVYALMHICQCEMKVTMSQNKFTWEGASTPVKSLIGIQSQTREPVVCYLFIILLSLCDL